jgi:hypothetical protein
MKRLFAGQKAIATDYFQKAVSLGKSGCCESIFAQEELKELGQGQAPAN